MDDETQLKLYESKLATYFARIQSIYDSMKTLSTERSRRSFIAQSKQIDAIRSEFCTILDNVNALNLKLDPKSEINYSALNAFDDLACEIKETLCSLVQQSAASNVLNTGSGPNVHHIQVPKITLPNFEGDIQSFPYFYETFKRVIHTNSDLSDCDRIHYLLSCLKGKANNIAAGLSPSADNYRVIWEALIAKYLDNRALAVNYLNQLFSLKSAGSSPGNIERVFDKFTATVAGLKQLNIDNLDDFIFTHLGLKLIDSDIAKHYEMSLRSQKDPQTVDYDYFVKFVREQVKIMYRTAPQRSESRATGSVSTSANPKVSQVYVATDAKCSLCQTSHTHLFKCNAFIKLNAADRFKFIKDNHMCGNCLSSQHTVSKCQSKTTCKKCNGKHHSLLHFEKPPLKVDTAATYSVSAPAAAPASDRVTNSPERVALCTHSASVQETNPTTEVLATAKVLVVGRKGKDIMVRCLLDPGSQKNYITTRCCRMLGLPIRPNIINTVKGIGGTSQPVRGSVDLTFSSRLRAQPKYNIDALVLDQITGQLPLCSIKLDDLPHTFDHKLLADDTWSVPGNIDILIGVKIFAKLLRPGHVTSASGFPDALETVLGYIIMGDAPILQQETTTMSLCALSSGDLRKFWEIEEVATSPIVSVDDAHCEQFFCSTTTRTQSGKYVTALPLKTDATALGNSLEIARHRFFSLERKLKANPKVKLMYDDVIKEYLEQNYISPVEDVYSESVSHNRAVEYYIPHHAVIREDKTTTKLRVVLDASAKTDNGVSLNDILHAGPALQTDLFNILLNFRLFIVAITADVKAMYLRIGVRPEDRSLQRILYRFSENEELQRFEFLVLPFGLKCSPFIAIRTVQQLVQDEGQVYPLAKEILHRDIYVDDIVSSVPNSTIAIDSAHQLIKLFSKGDFQLTKWSSSHTGVLQAIPESLRLSQSVDLSKDPTQKILGLRWFPDDDCFAFQVNPDDRPCTKRNILSSIARLFDVLGLVAPIILYAKLLIKELWLVKIGWDDIPPTRIVRLWDQLQTELPLISQMRFLRHIGVEEICKLSLVGFADASEKAYGGMVYAHVVKPNGDIVVSLVCAKSKVAPLKIVSLARLELCAALLLSTLIKRVYDLFAARHAIEAVVAFSDSTVTLSWIHSEPHRWHTYVANRIAKIHENLSAENFYHDCLSRGLTPAQLVSHPFWLNGPPWLMLPRADWPVKPFVTGEAQELPEMKPVALPAISHERSNGNTPSNDIFYERSVRFSSWIKYLKTICFVYKFLKRLPKGPITASDLEFVESVVWRSVQRTHFKLELDHQSHNELCSKQIQPSEPSALTPAQFLHTKPLVFLPSREVNETRSHLISRYELMDQIVQYFWKRRRLKYLHNLQSKQKWTTPSNAVKVGMVVVSMQDDIMPLNWPLGLITEIFPDKQGVCRVASVKTKHGILQRRPVVKLCPLPTQ